MHFPTFPWAEAEAEGGEEAEADQGWILLDPDVFLKADFSSVLRVKTDVKEGISDKTMTKIVLGISEDNDWGDDLLISCDTHRHISALGEIKVVRRSLFRSA